MNRREKAMQKLLTEPYVHATTIRDALKCDYEKAKEIFALAKEEELKKSLIDVRPNAVQSKTVIQITGSNYNYLKKQFKERMALKEIIPQEKSNE